MAERKARRRVDGMVVADGANLRQLVRGRFSEPGCENPIARGGFLSLRPWNSTSMTTPSLCAWIPSPTSRLPRPSPRRAQVLKAPVPLITDDLRYRRRRRGGRQPRCHHRHRTPARRSGPAIWRRSAGSKPGLPTAEPPAAEPTIDRFNKSRRRSLAEAQYRINRAVPRAAHARRPYAAHLRPNRASLCPLATPRRGAICLNLG